MKPILSAALLFLTASLCAAPIDRATLLSVLDIAREEGVPRSVAYQQQIEESGDWRTGAWGCATAIGKEKKLAPDEPSFPSKGLFQLHTRPQNLDHLVKTYWIDRGETETFDITNPIHNATVALRYVASLHRQLGTWYRAACAYNAGPENVKSGAVNREARFARTRAYAMRIVSRKEPELWN